MANFTPTRPLPLPGNPPDDDPGELADRIVSETAWSHLKRWHMHAPAERLPIPLALTAWPASWLMHTFHVSPELPGLATASAATLAALAWWQRRRKSEDPLLAPLEAAAVTGAIGGWITAADLWGPLAKPSDFLTWIYVGGASTGYWWLRRHEAVRAARQRRDDLAWDQEDRQYWHAILPRAGLGGWHMQDRWDTNLGEERLITTSPDNASATRIAANASTITEKLEHLLDLPYGRVDLRLTDLPGQLIISIRTVDMSTREAAHHPMTDPWPEDEPSPFTDWFPDNALIQGPKPWGFTPEDGSAQTIQLFNELGGRCVGVMGMTGSGKSNVLNNIREVTTRCSNARLVQINGAHMGDELTWEPVSALTLCGSVKNDEELRLKIAAALEALCLMVTNRSATLAESGYSTFQPTDEDPAVVVVIDEVDEIVRYVPGAGDALEFLASKQRKSAFALVLATQRGVVAALGGGGVRANMSEVLVGKVARATESRHMTGAETDVPDIREYSKGEPGYFQRYDPHSGQITGRGRAFLLGKRPEELAYIRRLVARRANLRDWAIHDLPEIEVDDGSQVDEATARELSALRDRLAVVAQDTLPGQSLAGPGQVVPAAPAAPALPQRMLLVPGVPPAVAGRLIELLRKGRMSAAAAGLALGVSKTVAHEYLKAMEKRGLVELDKRGRASSYGLTAKADVPAPRPSDEGQQQQAGYVTVAALVEAAHAGLVDDLSEDAATVLEQAWVLTHGDAQ